MFYKVSNTLSVLATQIWTKWRPRWTAGRSMAWKFFSGENLHSTVLSRREDWNFWLLIGQLHISHTETGSPLKWFKMSPFLSTHLRAFPRQATEQDDHPGVIRPPPPSLLPRHGASRGPGHPAARQVRLAPLRPVLPLLQVRPGPLLRGAFLPPPHTACEEAHSGRPRCTVQVGQHYRISFGGQGW